MDIKTVNEKLEQFFEKAAMVASNHNTFEENKIDSWIYVESGGQLTGKPSASLREKDLSNIRRVRPPYSNNTITYIKQKIKY